MDLAMFRKTLVEPDTQCGKTFKSFTWSWLVLQKSMAWQRSDSEWHGMAANGLFRNLFGLTAPKRTSRYEVYLESTNKTPIASENALRSCP